MSVVTRIYLDYNGTAPLRPEAASAMMGAFETCGNASAIHAEGRAARHLLENARSRIAETVGARSQEIIFTSGGTEANALALKGSHVQRRVVSCTDHDAVIRNAPGALPIPVDSAGRIELQTLDILLDSLEGPFVCSAIWGHNETGALNDIRALARLVHQKKGLFHTDAVQIAGKKTFSFQETEADLMTLSAHKMGGPPGIGVLIAKEQVPLHPLLAGGGQEKGLRSGTPNVALAQGFAAALEVATSELEARENVWRLWQKQLEEEISRIAPESLIVGSNGPRLSQTTCVTMEGVGADVQVMAFDLEGIGVSSGSACSSGKVSVSPKLLAMGIPESVAQTALRVSWGWATRESDLKTFLEVWGHMYRRLSPKRRGTQRMNAR